MDLANLLIDVGETRPAVACLKRLTQLCPEHIAAWQNLGVAHCLRGRFDEGIAASLEGPPPRSQKSLCSPQHRDGPRESEAFRRGPRIHRAGSLTSSARSRIGPTGFPLARAAVASSNDDVGSAVESVADSAAKSAVDAAQSWMKTDDRSDLSRNARPPCFPTNAIDRVERADFEIRHPEMAFLTRTSILIGIDLRRRRVTGRIQDHLAAARDIDATDHVSGRVILRHSYFGRLDFRPLPHPQSVHFPPCPPR